MFVSIAFVSMNALVVMYKFYGSVPVIHKNVITYFMRQLCIILMLAQVWHTTIFIAVQFPAFLQPWFDEYPNIMCCLLQSESMSPFMMLTWQSIFSLLTYLKLYPLQFHELNHERLYRQLLLVWGIVNGIEFFIPIFYYGTFCTSNKVTRITYVYGIDLSMTKLKVAKYKNVTMIINCFVLFIPIVYTFIKKKNKIAPIKKQVELPTMPKVTEYNKKVLLAGSYFRPLISKYGVLNLDQVAPNKLIKPVETKKYVRSISEPAILHHKPNKTMPIFLRSQSSMDVQTHSSILKKKFNTFTICEHSFDLSKNRKPDLDLDLKTKVEENINVNCKNTILETEMQSEIKNERKPTVKTENIRQDIWMCQLNSSTVLGVDGTKEPKLCTLCEMYKCNQIPDNIIELQSRLSSDLDTSGSYSSISYQMIELETTAIQDKSISLSQSTQNSLKLSQASILQVQEFDPKPSKSPLNVQDDLKGKFTTSANPTKSRIIQSNSQRPGNSKSTMI